MTTAKVYSLDRTLSLFKIEQGLEELLGCGYMERFLARTEDIYQELFGGKQRVQQKGGA